jgi:hypothetical protein
LLMHKHLLPNGGAVMLRACKSALAQRPDQTRAVLPRPGLGMVGRVR